MIRIICILLLAFIYNPVMAQKKIKKRKWQIVVIGDGFRSKGMFKDFTDTSVILLNKNVAEEITFDIINKIKLTPKHNNTEIGALGVSGGAILGAVGGSISLSAGRTGEPAALGGVIGGIGGGIAGALTGAIATQLIRNAFAKRKFILQHNDFYLQKLKTALKAYTLIQ